jgi:hypothetical protein
VKQGPFLGTENDKVNVGVKKKGSVTSDK